MINIIINVFCCPHFKNDALGWKEILVQNSYIYKNNNNKNMVKGQENIMYYHTKTFQFDYIKF